MYMKRQRTADAAKDLQKRVRRITEAREGSRILANAAKDLLAIARELRSDEKHAREDDEGDCSDNGETCE